MSRIEVDIAGLESAGMLASSAGSDVVALAGEVQAVAGAGGGAPPATEAALGAMAGAWSAGLAMLGEEIHGVGMAADAAAALYLQADTGSMCPSGG